MSFLSKLFGGHKPQQKTANEEEVKQYWKVRSGELEVQRASLAAQVSVTEQDMEILRRYWRHRANAFWQKYHDLFGDTKEEKDCDDCSSLVKRGGGYYRGSYLICEECAYKTTNAENLANLRRDPNYCGKGEVVLARAFAANNLQAALDSSVITPELVEYAKSIWVTADVTLVSGAKKLGYSTTPSPGSYEGRSIMLGICVSQLMQKSSALSESKAKEVMIVVLEDWHQIDKATASRLRGNKG